MMIWLLAHRRTSTKLRSSPFTETTVEGGHSVLYRPGVAAIQYTGQLQLVGEEGTFGRGLHRVSGFAFSFDGDAAETLLGIEDPIDLIVYYIAAQNEHRKRTFLDVVFVGDATVRVPEIDRGLGDLVGVPFKVNVPSGDTLADHVIDAAD
ncbi:MAG: hypothetical protein GY778_17925 [bacterium]|nr:hypothetical protein [bacterium]